MHERDYSSETLTADRILALLGLAVESPAEQEFDRLVNLTSENLLREVRKRLEANKLGVEQAADLLAMNALAVKSWLKSTQPLPEAAHHRLAGLCLVLSLVDNAEDSEPVNLARAAVCLVQSQTKQMDVSSGFGVWDTIAAVFGPGGLAAAALHSALIVGERHSSI